MSLTGDFISLFYPRTCLSCGKILLHKEKYICSHCRLQLPHPDFHDDKENPVNQLFWGRAGIESATAMYVFRKNEKIQKIIHSLKYENQKEAALWMGHHFGNQLKKTSSFADIHTVLPVPLHKKKEKQRGYNQSEMIAKGIAASMHTEICTNKLVRIEQTPTQTKKSRYARWENIQHAFAANPDVSLTGRKVLLVDDVLTTGATAEACVHCLKKEPDVKVSIAALAYANN